MALHYMPVVNITEDTPALLCAAAAIEIHHAGLVDDVEMLVRKAMEEGRRAERATWERWARNRTPIRRYFSSDRPRSVPRWRFAIRGW
jgi:hypothetical protein